MPSVVEYGTRRTLVVGAVMLAALMQLANTTIGNVALPAIDGALGATVDQGAWFIAAYIVANIIVIPLSPWFQTLLGRKNYFALSIAGFTVMSLLCGPQWAQTSRGFTTTLAGLLLMVRAGTFVALVATQVLGGIGYAFIWVPLSVVLFKTVPHAEIPSALALTRLVQQMGASAGSAYAATLLDRDCDGALSGLAGSITLHSSTVTSFLAAHGAQAVAQLSGLVSTEAQNLAAAETRRFFALVTMVAAGLPFLLQRYREQPPPAPAPALLSGGAGTRSGSGPIVPDVKALTKV